jgi:hypothetical protein
VNPPKLGKGYEKKLLENWRIISTITLITTAQSGLLAFVDRLLEERDIIRQISVRPYEVEKA